MWCLQSRLGPIYFELTAEGLSRVELANGQDTGCSERYQDVSESGDPMVSQVVRALLAYLESGDDTSLAGLPVDLSKATVFQAKVYVALREVRAGETITYGRLAEKVGVSGGARAVARAMAANPVPLVIPCHRVVASKGIGGFSAGEGLKTKRQLLALEGVSV